MPRGDTFTVFGSSYLLMAIGDDFRLNLVYVIVFLMLTRYMWR